MIFLPSHLDGAYVLEIEPHVDDRGFFARAWCEREAAAHGIHVRWVQCNLSLNHRKGTLRGMHWQAPQGEVKLVRVIRGAALDVVVDLRPDSRTYKQHLAVELSADNRRALLVPQGFAHGFCTLVDDTELFYQMSEFYVAGQDHGFHYDDPQFGLPWPEGEKIVSERDRNLGPYAP